MDSVSALVMFRPTFDDANDPPWHTVEKPGQARLSLISF